MIFSFVDSTSNAMAIKHYQYLQLRDHPTIQRLGKNNE
jgi:hypothetical protein